MRNDFGAQINVEGLLVVSHEGVESGLTNNGNISISGVVNGLAGKIDNAGAMVVDGTGTLLAGELTNAKGATPPHLGGRGQRRTWFTKILIRVAPGSSRYQPSKRVTWHECGCCRIPAEESVRDLSLWVLANHAHASVCKTNSPQDRSQ